MNTTTTQYKWRVRGPLVEHLVATLWGRKNLDATALEERLTDLSRSGSLLASEAKAAIDETSDSQFYRLLADVKREVA